MSVTVPPIATERLVAARGPGVPSTPTGAGAFEGALAAARGTSRAEVAREAAAKLVADAFVQPALASMRETGLAAGPFAPGAGERRFGPLLDQHLADRIVGSPSFPLVERLTEHLLGRAGGASGAEPTT